MKCLFTFFALSLTLVLSAADDVLVSRGTTVRSEIKGDITLDDKPGKAVELVVAEDVKVNDVVVIAKGAPVYATIRVNQKPKQNYYTGSEYMGELIIDIFSTKAIDGSEIKFADCYIAFYAEKNQNWFDKKRKWLIGTGTTKNCETRLNYTVSVP